MKLFNRVLLHLSVGIVMVLTLWAVCFYYAMMDEVNDEVDDSLEDYSEWIIMRSLAGEELPSNNVGTNNQFYLKEVSREYAMLHPSVCYKDSMIYLISLFVILLDQLTKGIILHYFSFGKVLEVFPCFNLLLAYNKGVSFSFLASDSPYMPWILSAFSLIVCAFIIGWMRQ
jgi:hypothetical protein